MTRKALSLVVAGLLTAAAATATPCITTAAEPQSAPVRTTPAMPQKLHVHNTNAKTAYVFVWCPGWPYVGAVSPSGGVADFSPLPAHTPNNPLYLLHTFDGRPPTGPATAIPLDGGNFYYKVN